MKATKRSSMVIVKGDSFLSDGQSLPTKPKLKYLLSGQIRSREAYSLTISVYIKLRDSSEPSELKIKMHVV